MVWMMDLEVLEYAENVRRLEVIKDPPPEGWIRGNSKIGPVLEVNTTYHLYQYGIEIKVGSVKNDGSQFWTVISRKLNKFVDELPLRQNKRNKQHHITFTLNDCCAHRSTEVARHSCRRLRRQGILVIQSRRHRPEYYDIEDFIETDAAMDSDTLLPMLCRDHRERPSMYES